MEKKTGSIDLSGKVALVTGGGRSIGATICLALAGAGADVVINYNSSRDEANKVCGKVTAMGRRAVTVRRMWPTWGSARSWCGRRRRPAAGWTSW